MIHIKLVPIIAYTEENTHLKYSLGEFFGPELLAQIEAKKEEDTVVIPEDKTNWCLWRKIRGVFKGENTVTNENWNKYLFRKEMWKIDIADAMKKPWIPLKTRTTIQ